MPVFTPVPTLAQSDVNSSTSGSVSLTFLPLLSISILIPIILFFTYRLFKRAPTLPVRLPLPAAWSQWLRGAAKGQSTKSRLPPSRVPQFIKRLSGLSQVELLPTAIKAIPTPSPSPYAYQVAFQPVPTRPGLSTAMAMDTRNLLSRSPSPADADDDYFLSPTKPQDWDLSTSAPRALPLRPISAPPQARSPSPKPAWSPVKEKRSTVEQHVRAKSTPFRLNITSLFTSSKPPPSRASSTSPYSHKRSKSLGVPMRMVSPPSPTSSLAPLIDFSISTTPSSGPVSSIGNGMSRTASVATEASDLGARKISSPTPLIPGLPIPPESGLEYVPTPEPMPIFKLIDAPTPEKQPRSTVSLTSTSHLTETPLGPVVTANFIQTTLTKPPPRAQKRGRLDEPLVRLSDSDNEADEEDEDVEVKAIQLKPITPMKKRMTSIPSPIALPPLPLSRATSAGQESILVDVESPMGSPASLRVGKEVEARTEQILVDIDREEEKEPVAGGFKYPFPMPMTPPPTAPSMGWAMESDKGEVWGWSSSGGMSNDEDPFISEAERELERALSPIMTMDVFEDPFADPADVTFVDEVEESSVAAVPSKQEIEPLALLAVAKEAVEHKQEFSPWDECREDELKNAEEVKDTWMTEDEKTMVAAEVSRLVEDDDDDVEVEVAVVLIEEETREPVGVVDCVVRSVLHDEEDDQEEEDRDVVVEEEELGLSTPVVVEEEQEVVIEDEENVVPISISLEQEDDFPDPDLLPLPTISTPVPIIVPQPILLSPVSPICPVSVEAKSPEREIQLQTPTPPASPPPPPTLSRTTSRSRSRLQTPVPSPRLKLVVELPDDGPAYTGSITVVPPSALPVEDHSTVVTPVSPRPTWADIPAESLKESIPEPEVIVSSSLEEEEAAVVESSPVAVQVPKEVVEEVQAVEEEEVTVVKTSPVAVQVPREIVEELQAEEQEADDEDIISSPIPGSFPSASTPASVQPPPAEKSNKPISQVDVSAHLRHIQKPRSAIDIALAMQLRPGLGPGADPAWMVRFLMSVFGWFVVTVSGNIQ